MPTLHHHLVINYMNPATQLVSIKVKTFFEVESVIIFEAICMLYLVSSVEYIVIIAVVGLAGING